MVLSTQLTLCQTTGDGSFKPLGLPQNFKIVYTLLVDSFAMTTKRTKIFAEQPVKHECLDEKIQQTNK